MASELVGWLFCAPGVYFNLLVTWLYRDPVSLFRVAFCHLDRSLLGNALSSKTNAGIPFLVRRRINHDFDCNCVRCSSNRDNVLGSILWRLAWHLLAQKSFGKHQRLAQPGFPFSDAHCLGKSQYKGPSGWSVLCSLA